VATALQYLHDSANLVHGDIKLDNVLLKSDAGHPRGFLVKWAAPQRGPGAAGAHAGARMAAPRGSLWGWLPKAWGARGQV
jgi:serine/threonine protein kinase